MNIKNTQDLTNDVLMADVLIRLKSLETLLISKGVFTENEFKFQIKEITQLLSLSILEKANVPGDHSKIIEDL